MGIELVVFDLGRVLIRICDDWDHAAEMAGLEGLIPELDPISRGVLQELCVLGEIGAISHRMFCQRVGHLFNIEADQVERISEAYLCGPFDGAEQLLTDLKTNRVKIACLSNTNDHHWTLMTDPLADSSKVLVGMDFRVASHLVGLRKPDDLIFAHVEQLCGVSSDQVLFFDDILDNIAAAETAGWNAVQVIDRDDPVTATRRELITRGLLPT